jgi:hypothetical protein
MSGKRMSAPMNEPASPPNSASAESEALPLPRRLRYYLEAAIFFSGIGFFRLFGVERASNIGSWIGRTLISRTPASRRARANLALAFPEKSEAEIEHIVRAMWSNLGRVGGEYAYLPLMHSVGPNPRIQVSGGAQARQGHHPVLRPFRELGGLGLCRARSRHCRRHDRPADQQPPCQSLAEKNARRKRHA